MEKQKMYKKESTRSFPHGFILLLGESLLLFGYFSFIHEQNIDFT